MSSFGDIYYSNTEAKKERALVWYFQVKKLRENDVANLHFSSWILLYTVLSRKATIYKYIIDTLCML